MKKLGEHLKRLMAYNHMNESQLSRLTGIGQPVIHRMASGETHNPKVATLYPIANYFGVNIDQLIGLQPLPTVLQCGSQSKFSTAWQQIPLLTWPHIAEWLNQTDHIEIITNVITEIPVDKLGYALLLQDTTMRPQFPEETMVIIEPSITPLDRDFAVIKLASMELPTFRQVLYDGGRIYLKALNSNFSGYYFDKDKDQFLGTLVQAKMNFASERVKQNLNQANSALQPVE